MRTTALVFLLACLSLAWARQQADLTGAKIDLPGHVVPEKVSEFHLEEVALTDVHVGRHLMQTTVTTSKSYFSRIKDALVGFVFGIILFIIAFPLLIWNEFKSASIYRLLERARGPCKPNVPSDKIQPENEGAFIHTSGDTHTEEPLEDRVIGLSQDDTMVLERVVEMYQWIEHVKERREDNFGGSQTIVKEYTYTKEWTQHEKNSHEYMEKDKVNPEYWPIKTTTFVQDHVGLGAFTLSGEQVKHQCTWSQEINLASNHLDDLRDEWKQQLRYENGYFYMGHGSLPQPQVGDIRVSFKSVKNCSVTVLAVQRGHSLTSYISDDIESQALLDNTEGENNIMLIQKGILTKEQMFRVLEARNASRTWLIRVFGFLCLFFGLFLIFRPVVEILNVIPFLAHIVAVGAFLVAFVLALLLFVAIVFVSWFLARPLLSVCLAGAVVGVVYAINALAGAN